MAQKKGSPISDDERERVVKDFLSNKDNSARAIAERLGIAHSRVDNILTQYFEEKRKKFNK